MAADPHHPTTSDAPLMTDAELLADRQQGWEGFMRFVTLSIATTVVVLVLLAIFVV